MSAATREKLFNPFFTTKGVTGTGLGLWLSKEMIDRHRGALRMRSSQSPKHRGTVFSIFLPFDAVIR
jgi:signal transduction histidine kinase